MHSTARDACAPLQSSSQVRAAGGGARGGGAAAGRRSTPTLCASCCKPSLPSLPCSSLPQRPRLTRRAPLAPARVATAARLSGGAAFAAAADITFARVTFRVPNCRLNFGEHLRVVGSCAELGSWDAAAAPMLNWQEGDCWVAELPLPPGECAFKLVVVRSDGGQQWEEGGDRRVQVPRLTALRAVCRFGDTSSMQVDGPAEPSGQVQVGAALEAIPRRASPGASSSRSRSQSPPRSRSSSSSANNQAANPLDVSVGGRRRCRCMHVPLDAQACPACACPNTVPPARGARSCQAAQLLLSCAPRMPAASLAPPACSIGAGCCGSCGSARGGPAARRGRPEGAQAGAGAPHGGP